MFEYKPDYETVRGRYRAWWNCEIVDRPLVSLIAHRPIEQRRRLPEKSHASLRERWFDVDYQAERALAEVHNLLYLGDALPTRYPNLGPEVFSAFYGCELEFGDYTSWSVPVLRDCTSDSLAQLRMNKGSIYYKKMLELTDAYIEVGRGKFIVGYTDLHPGGDALAALRNPENLCMDVLSERDAIRDFMLRVTDDFLEVYEQYHTRLQAAGMPSTSWLPAICDGRYHIPSNDFSCMISEPMFEDLFVPAIEAECAHMDRCIYHLDGPGALRHLDRLLEIPSIHAIQWVPGAGREYWGQWLEIYRRIQEKGRAFTINIRARELEDVMQVIGPEGAWVIIDDIVTQDEADHVLLTITGWRG